MANAEYHRLWRAANKDKVRAARQRHDLVLKERYATDPAYRKKRIKRAQKYYRKQRAAILAKNREWRKRNKSLSSARRSSIESRFRQGRSQAGVRGLTWSLDLEQYSVLVGKVCYYCGGALPTHGVGLDRLDNARGYEAGNVVPACKRCNVMRNDLVSSAEFKIMVQALQFYRSIYDANRKISQN